MSLRPTAGPRIGLAVPCAVATRLSSLQSAKVAKTLMARQHQREGQQNLIVVCDSNAKHGGVCY